MTNHKASAAAVAVVGESESHGLTEKNTTPAASVKDVEGPRDALSAEALLFELLLLFFLNPAHPRCKISLMVFVSDTVFHLLC